MTRKGTTKIKGSAAEGTIRSMFVKGKSYKEIARHVGGVCDKTVAAYINAEFPEMTTQEVKEYDVQLLASQIQATLKDVDSIRAVLRDRTISLKDGSPRDLGDLARAFTATDKRLDEKMETLFRLTHQLESIKLELKQINVYNSPVWNEVLDLVNTVFQPTPDQKVKLAEGLLSLQSGPEEVGG